MERRKIVIIGAGSAQFVQGLFGDLIRSGEAWQLGLVDIDPSALAVAEGLSRRMVDYKHADIVVEGSTDRHDLLPGADVVVLTVGVGGRRAWLDDVHIPRKYGVYQPVGDTIMAGGISRALRMVPALVDIARDVQGLCPNALFINYSNPMTVCCQAVRRATGANMVGLCIGTYGVTQMLGRLIGAEPGQITALAAGVNHFTWIYDLRRNGQDAWPQVRQKVAAVRAGKEDNAIVTHNPFCFELFENLGAYPSCNDGHVVEFFPERFPEGRYYGKPLGMGGINDIDQHIARIDATYQHMAALADGSAPMNDAVFERSTEEHSQLVEMVLGMETDSRKCYFANLPNHGLVPNLPEDTVLELTSVITARGFRGLQHPDFPDRLAGTLGKTLAGQALTTEAALTGDRRLVVEALLVDGCVRERAVAEKLANELLVAHAKYLPQFA